MAILAYFLVSVTLVIAGLSVSAQPADGQSSAPSADLASMRARLIGPNGALLVAPRRDTELHAGALSTADMPELLALARECRLTQRAHHDRVRQGRALTAPNRRT